MSSTSSYFEPNWTSAPGETISDLLQERGMTLKQLASKMNRPLDGVNQLIHGKEIVSNEIASQLALIFGGSADFWINRQEQFNQDAVRQQSQVELAWLKQLPVKDMLKFGWISDGKNKITECLNYFNVDGVPAWEEKYNRIFEKTAFRKSTSFTSELGSVATWLRQGEIKGERQKCEKWSAQKFEETLFKVKTLTRRKSPRDFLPILTEECAKCGVALAIVPTPTGCRASGATKFVSKEKALLLLSFRYLSDDQFWFTFFHEAGHILLHGHKDIFIEGVHEDLIKEQEEEANAFAGDHLIPHELHPELSKLKGNKRDIINFAIKAGISPGSVVGQMQYYNYVDKKYLNAFKRRYNWNDIPLN